MSQYIDSYSKEKYVEGQKSYIAFTPEDKSYVGRMQRGLVPSSPVSFKPLESRLEGSNFPNIIKNPLEVDYLSTFKKKFSYQ